MNTVLVVDDKELMRDSVAATLQRAGLTVVTAGDAEAALTIAARRRPDAVVTDLKMPGMTGIELLGKLMEIDDQLPVILMTAFGTVDTAVRAMKLGAFDYVTKPFEGDELVIAVKRGIEHARVLRENAVLLRSSSAAQEGPGEPRRRGLERLLGDSPAIRRVRQQVLAVSESHGTVLICGESGTGKEVVARAVHECSPRAANPFLAVNCAALSESLLESELFGHERGSFTGAERTRKGRFELADQGTLLLDEISEVSTNVQAKLLRVLQERAFERVGSSVTIGVDVRVVATSNRDLPKAAARGEFRQDLFFRLNVLPIHLPPLRDRLEDVPVLAAAFMERISRREGRGVATFDDGAFDVLCTYHWPGNVRELENICERAAVLCRGETVVRETIEPWLLGAIGSPAGSAVACGSGGGGPIDPGMRHVIASFAEAKPPLGVEGGGGMIAAAAEGALPAEARLLEDIEREAIIRALRRHRGHRQKTAQSLGIGVRTLGLKLKKWKQMNLVEASL